MERLSLLLGKGLFRAVSAIEKVKKDQGKLVSPLVGIIGIVRLYLGCLCVSKIMVKELLSRDGAALWVRKQRHMMIC
jgi:hypothetical protein